MQTLIDQLNAVIPQRYQVFLAVGWLLIQALGRCYHAIASGDGLAGIWRGLIFGTNTPSGKVNVMVDKPAKTVSTLPLLLVLIGTLAVGGCANFNLNAFKTTGVTVVTVDAAMNAWGDYVRSGAATPDQQAKVRALYNKYQAAVLVEQDAVLAMKSGTNTVPASTFQQAVIGVSASASDAVTLIEQFLPNAQLKQLKGVK